MTMTWNYDTGRPCWGGDEEGDYAVMRPGDFQPAKTHEEVVRLSVLVASLRSENAAEKRGLERAATIAEGCLPAVPTENLTVVVQLLLNAIAKIREEAK